MPAPSFSGDIAHAANVHLSVLEDFIFTVQRKLNETANPFARDSLTDMLANLKEQRDSYLTLSKPSEIPA